MDSIYVVAVLCIFFAVSFAQSTTPHINEVFIGKCYEKNPTGVVCSDLWQEFSAAAVIGNNVVNDTDYAPFFKVSDFSTPKDNILFWSGNQAFAIALANDGTRFTTVEETSTGYILNGLSWCGVPGAVPPRFDYTNPCLYPSNSTYYGTQGVWAQSSKRFAQGAQGNITILLQPAQLQYKEGPYMAYRNTSVFSQVELPNINASRVTSATVLLITNLTLAPEEHCGSGSLITLQKELKERLGFEANCIDDPKEIYLILCPQDDTETAQCLAATLAYSETEPSLRTKEHIYFVWALAASITVAALLVLVVYYAIRAKRAGYVEI